MKADSRKSIREKLLSAIGKTTIFATVDHPDLPYRHHGVEINFAYGEDVRELFGEIAETLLKREGWNAVISEKAVYDGIFGLVRTLLLTKDSSTYDLHINRFLELSEAVTVEQVVCVPLFGIEMECEKMKIGRVMLERMTQQRVEEVIGRVPNFFGDTLRICLEEGVYSVFRAVAEPQRAKEIAIEETRRVVDLLRLAVILLEIERPPEKMILLGMEHETNFSDEHRRISIIPVDGRSYEVHFGGDRHYFPMRLDAVTKSKMASIGVFKISAILQKSIDAQTDFEKTLLRAIHWFANYQTQFENENRLLSLITCLETFFTPKDGNPIGTAIAEGVAFIHSEDLETRKKTKRKIREMYQMRSAVSHGGQKAVLDSELHEILEISRTLMLRMIARHQEFRDRNALLNWIEEQKLG